MPRLQVAPSDRRTRSQARGRLQTRWVRGAAGETLVRRRTTVVDPPPMQRDDEDDEDEHKSELHQEEDQEQEDEEVEYEEREDEEQEEQEQEDQEPEHQGQYQEDQEQEHDQDQGQEQEDEEDYDCGENEDLSVEHIEAEFDEDGEDEEAEVDDPEMVDDQDDDQDEDQEMCDQQDEEDLNPPPPPSNNRSRSKRTTEPVSHDEEPPSKRLRRGRSAPGASSSFQHPQARSSSTTVDRSSKDEKEPEPSRRRSQAPSPQPVEEPVPASQTAIRVVIFLRDDDLRGPAFNTINSHCQSVPYFNRQNQFHQPAWTLALADVEKSDFYLSKFIQHGHGFHQSIVTALHILEEGKKGTPEERFNVEIRAWTDGAVTNLLQEMQNNSVVSDDNPQPEPQPYTIILIIDTSMNDPTETPKPCDEFAALPTPNVRIYPCRQEMEGDNGKIHDIYAFDEAAVVTGTADARPTTCFGLSGHQTDEPTACPLRDEKTTMYKRTWSGFGNHVRAIEGRHLPLTCLPIPRTTAPPPEQPVKKRKEPKEPTRTMPPRSARKEVSMQTTNITTAQRQKSTSAFTDADFQIDLRETDRATTRRQRWFHQRVVPTLKRGEFRVFIGTKKSADGLRGREGYVLQVVHTATRRDPAQCRDYINVLAMSTDDDDDGVNDWTGAKVRDVQDFALATFETLRRKRDKAFESLEVGCRLDIGVMEAVDGGGGLFVNELTRWYGATYFSSDALALPKTRICARFARSFADWVRTGGYREVEEWEEEEEE
ncbi:hypothetical protein MCOR25_010291 [Pyricularia grisea]|uniref:Uncharacterized protein n=1 Tax=Pyricularia grisea TaxID=148305 RepID=A0A6P8AWG4_PYRGI|nr:uncharacterized protein PgNI_08456 [Pyricularia grisea]KAI6350908.1 hypothetical protein MCOR25_010291 [Pyricularia grisea]TLD06514.1 hypothetical protein PgNI_08456 [Pyricularia grisea]